MLYHLNQHIISQYQGERNLQEIISKERVAGKDWTTIKTFSNNLMQAIGHMHKQGYMHGDIKVC